MKRVLFAGDINVDVIMGGLDSLPVVDKEVLCRTYEVCMGSSAVIAACAYSCLGSDVSFLGLAGKDDYGEFMLRGLESFGIKTEFVRRTDKVRTGVTVNLIHESTRTQVTYAGTIAEFDGSDVDERVLRNFQHVHFAGPYLQTNFRPHITRLLKLSHELKLTTSLDPQWDPTEKWQYMDQWLPLLDYLSVNEGEALSLAKAKSLEDACRTLNSRTRCAIVKAGRDGALACIDSKVKTIPTCAVTVVDTTGAGDSFDAGFLYATLERNLPLAEAVAFGNAVGSRSCTFAGGVAARSTCQDILNFMRGN
jgi:sugar/nucleoside kinase (ribokinase family)